MITIDGFVIDAAREEELSFESEVTSYPIERGADFTDHVRQLPKRLRIEGLVSDSPLGAVAELRGAETTSPSQAALDHFETLHDTGEPVTVSTPRRTYQNMVLEELNTPVDAKTGAAFVFTATFRQVTIVDNKRTTVSIPRAKKKRVTSKAPTREALSQTRVVYDENGNAVGRERVFYDPKANKGRGTYYREDGKTELTQEELQSYNDDLEADGNKPRLRGSSLSTAEWVDSDGAPLGLNPRGGVAGTEPTWEEIWFRDSDFSTVGR